MRIAVVQPPLRDFYRTPHRHAALGCFAVKALLEAAGHQVRLFNFPMEGKAAHTPPFPKELNYLKPFLLPGETGPVSWFRQRKHYGPSFEACAEEVRRWEPRHVMISCFAWCYAEEARLLAAALQKACPGVPLEVGGAGASVHPRWFEKTGLFERVRTGPAEENLRDFPGMPRELPEILPVINRTAPFRGRPQFSAMLTRGCPARCSFCANHLTLGRRFRKIPAETLLGLLKGCGEEEFHLNLEDDNLLADREYFLDFLTRFRRAFPRATLSAENGLDYRRLTLPAAAVLIDSGFTRFNFSLASADRSILKGQNREAAPGRLEELVAYGARRGVPSVCYFICGLPGDSPASVGDTLLYLRGLPVEIGISPFYAVPGLPGFERPGEGGLPAEPRLYCGSSVYPWQGNLSSAQLITAFRLSRFLNLLRSPGRQEWSELIALTLRSKTLHTVAGKGKTRRILPVPRMDGELSRRVLSGI